MNVQETAEAVVSAINANDWETVASYLADDFQFSGPVPEPIGPAEWIGTNMALNAGMPDMAFNVQIVGVEGNTIRTVSQMTGTHTADLDLTQMGIGVIPATGNAISLPAENGASEVVDGKLVSLHLDTPPGGGMFGMLAQLGVELPPT
jgi:predicted ester cyclase